MAKRLSDKQKEKITQDFVNGKNINDLVEEFSSTKLTISRYLKKNLGEQMYQTLLEKSKTFKENFTNREISASIHDKNQLKNKVVKISVVTRQFIELSSLYSVAAQ